MLLCSNFKKRLLLNLRSPKAKSILLKSNAFSTAPQNIILKPENLANFPAPKITTLPNGLRVATEKMPHIGGSATVGIWIDAGSRYETPSNNGAAHFIEHLAFKGTQKRSQLRLEKEVESMGGRFNAYTSREMTAYYMSAAKGDIPQAVDILSDVLLNSSFSTRNIEAERSTISTEEKEVYKCMQEYTMDFLHESAYPNDPLGQTILGPAKNIASLKRHDLIDYVKKHYLPERMVLSASGAVDHSEIVKLAEEKFGMMRRGGDLGGKSELKKAKYVGGDYRERQDGVDMAHVAIAYETAGWRDPDIVPLLFIQTLLGNYEKGMSHVEHSSSRLASTVSAYRFVEKMMPFNTVYSDTGLLGVYLASYESRLHEAISCLMRAFNDLCEHVTDDHVDDVRNKLTTTVFEGAGSAERNCEDLARQVLVYGRKVPPAEFVARLNAVDAAAVRAAARRFLYDKDHSMAAVGPIVELPPYPWIRRRSYSLLN